MNLLQALILGALQGATEFLPVSSSGHLVLVPWLLGWNDPGSAWYLDPVSPFQLAFDTVVHWGTALAVIVYLWRDWVALIQAGLRSLAQRSLADPQGRLAWLILLGTLPAAVLGYLLEGFFEEMFTRPVAAAGFLLLTAVLLACSEWFGRRQRDLDTLNWLDALVVGLAQAVAIFPGISRSGATIAGGLARGLRREPAARFSFLLATPVILGAGLLQMIDLAGTSGLAGQIPALAVGFVAASGVGFGCIAFLLHYLQHRRLYPFAIYCAAAGLLCLAVGLIGRA